MDLYGFFSKSSEYFTVFYWKSFKPLVKTTGYKTVESMKFYRFSGNSTSVFKAFLMENPTNSQRIPKPNTNQKPLKFATIV